MSRAERNNNPGNIRQTTPRTPWQGRVPAEALTDAQFEQFAAPEWGARALARTLITYQDAHGLRTIHDIITRWAPPQGRANDGQEYTQDTAAYIRHVEQRTGFNAREILDMQRWEHLRPLMAAIARHESGVEWDSLTLDQGALLAGVKPPQRSVTKTGAGVGLASAGALLQLADVKELAEQITPLAGHGPVIAGAVVGLIVLGVGLALYGRWQVARRTGV